MNIRDELKNTIEREVMISQAITSAAKKLKTKSLITRRAIEDLKELAALEDDWINGELV